MTLIEWRVTALDTERNRMFYARQVMTAVQYDNLRPGVRAEIDRIHFEDLVRDVLRMAGTYAPCEWKGDTARYEVDDDSVV